MSPTWLHGECWTNTWWLFFNDVQHFANTVVAEALWIALHRMVNQWFKNCTGWKPVFFPPLSSSALK